MRLALYQGPLPQAAASAEDARDAYVAAIGAAASAARPADLLVCPEMSATGYNIGRDAVTALAEPADGAVFAALSEAAARAGIAIVYGYPERAGDTVFNAVRAVGPDGSALANYRKTHLYGELDHSLFSAGDELVVQFDLAGFRVGLLACYDVEFPEAVRAHAVAGTDLLVVPTGLMTPYDSVSTLLVPARALESQLFLAYVNRCGTEGEMTYCGSSCVVGPDGVDLTRAGDVEQIVYADVDLAVLRRSRADNPYLRDRRPELYGAVVMPSRVAT